MASAWDPSTYFSLLGTGTPTFTNGDRTFQSDEATHEPVDGIVISTTTVASAPSGKVTVEVSGNFNLGEIGLVITDDTLTIQFLSAAYLGANNWVLTSIDGTVSTGVVAATGNDVISIDADFTAKTAQLRVNNTVVGTPGSFTTAFPNAVAVGLSGNNRAITSNFDAGQLAYSPPSGHVSWDAFAGGGAGTQSLTASLFTDTDVFFSPTVTKSIQDLIAPLYTDTDQFFSPTVVNRGDLIGTLQANNNTIPTNFSATGSVAVSVGDLIASLVCQQTNLTVTGVTDNLGNTYTAQNAGTDAGGVTGRLFYSIVTNAGTLTSVTAACTTSANDGVHIVGVWKGAFGAIDKNIANITSDVTSPFTAPSSGTLNQADEIVISWGVANHSTSWSTSSPSLQAIQLANSTTIKAALSYRVVAATTAVSPAFTAGSNPSQAVLGTLSFTLAAGSSSQNLDPSLFSDTDVFFSPTVTRGAVGLTAGLFDDTETFFPATLVASYTLTAPLFADTESFYSATITTGGVTLTAALFTDTESFYSPTVASDAVELAPAPFSDTDTFFSAVVAPGGVTLTAGLYADTDAFFAAAVSAGGVTLAPAPFTDTEAFYSATLTPGAVALAAALFADSDSFYSPTVSSGDATLSPGLFVDADTFFGPTVSLVAPPVVEQPSWGGGGGYGEFEQERPRRRDAAEEIREALDRARRQIDERESPSPAIAAAAEQILDQVAQVLDEALPRPFVPELALPPAQDFSELLAALEAINTRLAAAELEQALQRVAQEAAELDDEMAVIALLIAA